MVGQCMCQNHSGWFYLHRQRCVCVCLLSLLLLLLFDILFSQETKQYFNYNELVHAFPFMYRIYLLRKLMNLQFSHMHLKMTHKLSKSRIDTSHKRNHNLLRSKSCKMNHHTYNNPNKRKSTNKRKVQPWYAYFCW